jgi:transcriptional regulator with XRE-family HTH domain
MIGLEYILSLYGVQHQELAEKLGIKKQNINLWIKGKQNVSKKYLPTLSEMFGIDEEYFQKEVDEIDKLLIQKEKIWRDWRPEVLDPKLNLSLEKLEQAAIKTEAIEVELEKARLIKSINSEVSSIKDDIELQIITQIDSLIREYRHKNIFKFTINAISHYYKVIPEWVRYPDSNDFIEEFMELIKKYDL